jgi:5-(carboxyamino)imidazole ribonucleotide synthase
VTANLLGDVDSPRTAELVGTDSILATPEASLHWYGKREVRPLRKMGHVTLADAEMGRATLLSRARELVDGVTFE